MPSFYSHPQNHPLTPLTPLWLFNETTLELCNRKFFSAIALMLLREWRVEQGNKFVTWNFPSEWVNFVRFSINIFHFVFFFLNLPPLTFSILFTFARMHSNDKHTPKLCSYAGGISLVARERVKINSKLNVYITCNGNLTRIIIIAKWDCERKIFGIVDSIFGWLIILFEDCLEFK